MKYIMTIVGTVCMAFAVGVILEPAHLVTGGISGIGIIIKPLTGTFFIKINTPFEILREGIPLWVTTIMLNIPLFILALREKGKRFVANSLLGTLSLTIFLALLPDVSFMSEDLLVRSLFGGLIEGIGVGLVLRAGASTGGSDLLASVLHEHMPQYSISQIMAVIDGIIVLAGIVVFGVERGGYALIIVYLVSTVSDRVVGGVGNSLLVYIISDKAEQISNVILKDMERGVTAVYARGNYQRKDKTMLLCVIGKKQLADMKKIVYKYDKTAFFVITQARETWGEGFLKLGNNTR